MGKLVVTSALTGFVQIEWHQRAAGFLCVPRSLGWSFVNTVCWYIGTSLFVLPMVKSCMSPWLVASYRYGWKAAAYDRVDEHLQVWRFPKMRLSPNHLKGRSPNHIEAAPWLSIETTMVIWFGGPPWLKNPLIAEKIMVPCGLRSDVVRSFVPSLTLDETGPAVTKILAILLLISHCRDCTVFQLLG